MASRRRGFISGSGTPAFAATVISRANFAKSLARIASRLPLRCMIFLNCEWPAIGHVRRALRIEGPLSRLGWRWSSLARRFNELRDGGFQMRPLTQGLNTRGKASRIVGIDQQARDRSRAEGRLVPAARDFRQEAVDRLVAIHAENRIIIAAHAGIRHVGRSRGQYASVGRRRVRMRADSRAHSTVEVESYRLLFARRLGMEIDQD